MQHMIIWPIIKWKKIITVHTIMKFKKIMKIIKIFLMIYFRNFKLCRFKLSDLKITKNKNCIEKSDRFSKKWTVVSQFGRSEGWAKLDGPTLWLGD